jgi:hypothetical protein
MAQQPKPPLITAAAVLLFVVGALNILSGVLVLTAGLGALELLFALLGIAVGGAALYAGSQVLALREQGRVMGMAIAAVGLAFGLVYLIQGFTAAILGLLLNGFIVYALTQTRTAFSR